MNMNELDAFRCPLDGMNLIEAGAGTGKTYTIQTLVARILLEQAVPIEKILVVTFTRAATAELRDRVHKVLLSLQMAVNGELASSDREFRRCQTILNGLRQLPATAPFWANAAPDDGTLAKRASGLLANALRDFDQAAISTIHGFCQRMLTENAFESGIRYGMELRSDISDVSNALIQQFIRKEFYQSGEDVMAVWDALGITWQEATRDEDDGGNSHNNSSKRSFARDI
ncbi:MAG: UvrD-helicase domain-containing protein, partial [Clostridia bacterium]|nr:UvrD-helicase domain-containing protein [Clostridia bacterium]